MNLKNSRMIPQAPNSRQGIVDSRLSDIYQLLPPVALVEKFPATDFTDNLVKGTRKVFHDNKREREAIRPPSLFVLHSALSTPTPKTKQQSRAQSCPR